MAFDQGYADALAQAATLRQELAASEAACASAMAEVEALRQVEAKLGQAEAEIESVRVLLWPDGDARRVPQQRTDGMATAVDWLLTQRVTLTQALYEDGHRLDRLHEERDHLVDRCADLRTAVAHIVAMVDHGTAEAALMHAVVQLRRFVEPEVTS